MAKKTSKSIQESVAYKVTKELKGGSHIASRQFAGGAHSMGIGRKVVAGKATDKLCMRYYVEKKRPDAKLSKEMAIPKKHKFFSRVKGRDVSVDTDVIECPRPEYEMDPKDRLRPVPGGSSIGTPPPPGFINAGTLGGWVWDLEDDSIVMLSNEHVLGSVAGVDIAQPGTLDGGSFPADKIGEVKRGIPRSTTMNNTVDCAIGDPTSADTYKSEVIDISPAVYAIDDVLLDMDVEKFGRTTEHTFGIVDDADYTTTLTSGHTFVDCFRIDTASPSSDWSSGGDSGSLIFSQQVIDPDSEIKPVVGLHFAGGGTTGVGCRIQNVFSELNLTTLCSGAFASFLDGLFDSEVTSEEVVVSNSLHTFTSADLIRPGTKIPADFFKLKRPLASSKRFHAGISRDIQSQLSKTKRGRMVNQFVDNNRDELLRLLAQDRDIQRATVHALKPLVAGAITTSDVLSRQLTELDVSNLQKLSKEVAGRTSNMKLKTSLKMMQALGKRTDGKKISDVFGIKLG